MSESNVAFLYQKEADEKGLLGTKSPLTKKYRYYRNLLRHNGIKTQDFRVIGGFLMHTLSEHLGEFKRLHVLAQTAAENAITASDEAQKMTAGVETRLRTLEEEVDSLRATMRLLSARKVEASDPELARRAAIAAGVPVIEKKVTKLSRRRKANVKRELNPAPKE